MSGIANIFTDIPQAQRFLDTIPACAALQITQASIGTHSPVSLVLPYTTAAATDGALDQAALIVLVDQAGSAGISAMLDHPQPMTTLQLRIDIHGAPGPGEAAIATIRHVTRRDRLHWVDLSIRTADQPIASATVLYLVGLLPGGLAIMPPQPRRSRSAPPTTASFTDLLGLHGTDTRTILPAHDWLIGAPHLPAFHGGMVGAALHAAASRLAKADATTASIDYLRPAIADRPLTIDATILRAGRTVTVIDAIAWQDAPDRIVATARCLFDHAAPAAANP